MTLPARADSIPNVQKLNAANILTVGRLVLAPLYVLAYALTVTWPGLIGPATAISAMWVLFLVMELTDVLDGMVARRQGLVTDLGKVLDPFADVVCRLTYFTVLTVAGIMPLWFVFIVLYRELGAVFLRLLFYRDGFALGAGTPGKLKSWFYSLAALLGLFLFTMRELPEPGGTLEAALPVARLVALVVYAVAGVLAVWSIGGYLCMYIRRSRGTET